MAILTAEHLYLTAAFDRRKIADLHEAVRLGSERVDRVLAEGDGTDDTVKIARSEISTVGWHRTTRTIEIGKRAGGTVELVCAESESTEEIGRGLQRSLSPTAMPTSEPIERSVLVRYELRRGKGRFPLAVSAIGLVIAIVAFFFNVWIGLLFLAVAAVALVAVGSIVRDADHSVPVYMVTVDEPTFHADE